MKIRKNLNILINLILFMSYYTYDTSSEKSCQSNNRKNTISILLISTIFLIGIIIEGQIISEGIDTTITISTINFNNIDITPSQPIRYSKTDNLAFTNNATFSISSMTIWAIPKSYNFIFIERYFVQVVTGQIYESALADLVQCVKVPGYGTQQRIMLFCENGKINGTSLKMSADYEITISLVMHINISNTIYPIYFYSVFSNTIGYKLSANPITINILGIEYLYDYLDMFLDLDVDYPETYRNPLTLKSLEFKFPCKIITEIIPSPWFL
jgi:hypothetical protein